MVSSWSLFFALEVDEGAVGAVLPRVLLATTGDFIGLLCVVRFYLGPRWLLNSWILRVFMVFLVSPWELPWNGHDLATNG